MATLSDLTLILDIEQVLQTAAPRGYQPNTSMLVRPSSAKMGANGISNIFQLTRPGIRFHRGTGLDTAVGDTAPSLRIHGWHKYRLPFLVPVSAGARTITIRCLQPDAAAARCQMIVKANQAVGILADLSAEASVSTGWQSLTVNFTATAKGALTILLLNPGNGYNAWFDALSVT